MSHKFSLAQRTRESEDPSKQMDRVGPVSRESRMLVSLMINPRTARRIVPMGLLLALIFSSFGPAIEAQAPSSSVPSTLRVAAVGQAHISTDLRHSAPVAVEQAHHYLQAADVRFTNLEAAVATPGRCRYTTFDSRRTNRSRCD